jgi:hypothetical protein
LKFDPNFVFGARQVPNNFESAHRILTVAE